MDSSGLRSGGRSLELDEVQHEVVKCVVVGDTAVGKTRLICARVYEVGCTLQQLVQTHTPTVWAIDRYKTDPEVQQKSLCTIDDVPVALRLWDTFGWHDKDRAFAYSRADVVLICFSVARPASLRHVETHWAPEVKRFCGDVPVVLCGTQTDLRYLCFDEAFIDMDKGLGFPTIHPSQMVVPSQGHDLAKTLGAAAYYEASVLTQNGVRDVFDNVIRAALLDRRKMRFWNQQLKKVSRLLLQEPLELPKPPVPVPKAVATPLEDFLSGLFLNPYMSDLVFVCNSEQFVAHRAIILGAMPALRNVLMQHATTCIDDDDTFGDNKLSPNDSKVSPDSNSVLLPDLVTCCPDTESLLPASESSDHCLPIGASFSCDNAADQSVCSATANQDSSHKTCSASNVKLSLTLPVEAVCIVRELSSHEESQVMKSPLSSPTSPPPSSPVLSATLETLPHPSDSQPGMDGAGERLVVVLDSQILDPRVLRCALSFVYKIASWHRCLQDTLLAVGSEKLQQGLRALGMRELGEIAMNVVRGASDMNLRQELAHECRWREEVRSSLIQQGLFADVKFRLEDGCVTCHRVLLASGSDVMAAMFSDNFTESTKSVIPFPGVTKRTFQAMREYLYLGEVAKATSCDWVELIELANQFCLPRLVAMAECRIVEELEEAVESGHEVVEEVLGIVEIALLHNADQLRRWCLRYLCVNYRQAHKRHLKLLNKLDLTVQSFLNLRRWPPLWYLRESDRYRTSRLEEERYLFRRERFHKRQASSIGCLGFCGRRKYKRRDDGELEAEM